MWFRPYAREARNDTSGFEHGAAHCESKAASCRFQRVQLGYTGHHLCYAQLFEVCEVERGQVQLCTCTVFAARRTLPM